MGVILQNTVLYVLTAAVPLSIIFTVFTIISKRRRKAKVARKVRERLNQA